MPTSQIVPVLVAGAGPAGLAAAITLARQGVEVLVVERRAAPLAHPRATVLSTRSMELVRSWGLEPQVLAAAVDVEWSLLEAPTLARAAEGVAHPTGYPSRAQAAVLSPSAPECVAQDHLERVLLDHLRSLPCARIVPETEVAGLTPRRGAVEVELTGAAAGRVHARYVVGADGARSAVRAATSIALHGPGELGAASSLVLHGPLWDVAGPHRHGVYTLTEPAGAGVLVPAGGERWVYGSWATDPAALAARVTHAVGVTGLPLHVGEARRWTVAALLADRYRDGRVLLAGDAAHRATPRGGTGLNVAFQDGHAIGWRLAWVLRGWAGEDLLDDYEAQRRPVARHTVTRSVDPLGSRRPAIDELHTDLAGRLTHAWLQTRDGGPRVSTLDLVGDGQTALLAPGVPAGPGRAAAPGRPPLAVRRLDAAAARALGLGPAGALLVRPDGVPLALETAGASSGDVLPRLLSGAGRGPRRSASRRAGAAAGSR